jgi:hypothetical protein
LIFLLLAAEAAAELFFVANIQAAVAAPEALYNQIITLLYRELLILLLLALVLVQLVTAKDRVTLGLFRESLGLTEQ